LSVRWRDCCLPVATLAGFALLGTFVNGYPAGRQVPQALGSLAYWIVVVAMLGLIVLMIISVATDPAARGPDKPTVPEESRGPDGQLPQRTNTPPLSCESPSCKRPK
jgi:hypothetical protein